MEKPIPYLFQGENIILVIDGKSHTVSKDTHIAYAKIVKALRKEQWGKLRKLVEPKQVIVDFGHGFISIVDNIVSWKGQPFHNALSHRMLTMYQEGFPIEPMVRFMENLMQNPSKSSVEQLYGFLEKNKLPITEDGHFLAYKVVSPNYKDKHTNTIDNSVGQAPSMERNRVDDDPNRTCSTGYHFCSEEYVSAFRYSGDHLMIVKVNPADVVSVPTDYNNAKCRCMKYKVVGEVTSDNIADAFNDIVDRRFNDEPVDNSSDDLSVDEFFDDFYNEVDELYGESDAINGVTGRDFTEEDFGDSSSFWKTPSDVDARFNLVRVHGDWVEYKGLTLEEARARRDKNVLQKKAMLKIIDTHTGKEVD